MKRSILILFCFTTLALGGCENWLSVSPGSLVDGDDLFTSETGFKQALTGAYTRVATGDLYARNMSVLIPEALAQHWTVGAVSSSSSDNQRIIHSLNNYEYKEAKTEKRISDVWAEYYKVIAQLNDILQSLKDFPVSFYNNNDKLIEGEALGLRAFLHLEVLRLFGPVPSADRSTTAIPYINIMTKEVNSLQSVSYGEVITQLLADLDQAEEILAEYDPIMNFSNEVLNARGTVGPAEDWQFMRQSRFNYYAVLGTKARLYQWIGDTENATKYAKMVIDATNSDGSKKFKLANVTELAVRPEYSFRSEHLFGVNNTRLTSIAVALFLNGTPPLLSNAKASMDGVFPESRDNDIRYTSNGLWMETEFDGKVRMLCLKYTGSGSLSGAVNYNLVPMLRLAEMYLIMIENLPLVEITPYLTEYLQSRNVTTTIIDEIMIGESNRSAQVTKEYRKEFFAEGQMFYYYKRKEATTITNPVTVTMSLDNYVVPKPQGQIKFE